MIISKSNKNISRNGLINSYIFKTNLPPLLLELHQLVTFRMVALTLHFSRAAEASNDVLSNFPSLRLVLFEFTCAFEPLVGLDPTDCYKEGHS
jgi:hypothetical protein